MLALIALSDQGAKLARLLKAQMPGSALFFHQSVLKHDDAVRFERILDLVPELFKQAEGLVFIGPCGVAVRAVAPCLENKHTDPPLVAVDIGGRWVVSLTSGHEGGANDLAFGVANLLGAEPIITTTTESAKALIVGIGCRRGCKTETIIAAVHFALQKAGLSLNQVRCLASADIKAHEPGLNQAARHLGLPLRFIAADEIRRCRKSFDRSRLVEKNVKLPAVAEPSALLAGRRTVLILPKTVYNQVTVAIALENCL